MSAIFRCNICKEIDESRSLEEELCVDCDILVTNIRNEAFAEAVNHLEGKFGILATNQMKVIGLMAWLRDEKGAVFRQHYGSEGEALLLAATGEIVTSPTIN